MAQTKRTVVATPLESPVEFMIECRTSPNVASQTRHSVTIHEDWTVTTPHDLDAERVGVAFGGYSSCAVLVDVTVPAVRAVFPLLTRRERPTLQHSQRGWSIVSPHRKRGCCLLAPYPEVREAARHILSDVHLAHGSGAPLWQFGAARDALARAQGFAYAVDACDVDPVVFVDTVADLRELWNAGIEPGGLAALAAHAAAVGSSLSVTFYLRAAYGTFDPHWFSAVLSARPDIDTAVWLIGLDAPDTLADTEQWRQWLLLGVRRDEALFAVTNGLQSSVVTAIADALGWGRAAVAETLVRFATLGFPLTAEHFVLFVRHGVDHPVPLVRAVDEIEAQLNGSGRGARSRSRANTSPNRTELAVMLSILGTRSEVVAAIGRGIKVASDLPLNPLHHELSTLEGTS